MSVYDNEHCGDHLDIMSNFDITSDDGINRELHTFCWLYRPGDACLAAAGVDGLIHILSLADSQEIKTLEGHTSNVSMGRMNKE